MLDLAKANKSLWGDITPDVWRTYKDIVTFRGIQV